MTPFIRIFGPDGHRKNFWIILFYGTPTTVAVHETDTEEQAEALACRLAQQHDCHFKFMPALDHEKFRHWRTEDGGLREIDRVE